MPGSLVRNYHGIYEPVFLVFNPSMGAILRTLRLFWTSMRWNRVPLSILKVLLPTWSKSIPSLSKTRTTTVTRIALSQDLSVCGLNQVRRGVISWQGQCSAAHDGLYISLHARCKWASQTWWRCRSRSIRWCSPSRRYAHWLVQVRRNHRWFLLQIN